MTQIKDLADQIATDLDIDRDAALTIATTYAAQCGYDVPEGGQAPDVEVSNEDAEFIAEAARRGAETYTPAVLDEIADAARAIDQAVTDRDALIRRAIDDGVSVIKIGEAAGLHRNRIYQIRDGVR
ncbi:hypothetical protein AB0H71_13550 [Nocardia sp. NPDC050697]|uniref:hypothetical protein n=1 Tax=Nocardia sp. NPDC050697 TaxID=3155158 RepID=UPI0033E12BB0